MKKSGKVASRHSIKLIFSVVDDELKSVEIFFTQHMTPLDQLACLEKTAARCMAEFHRRHPGVALEAIAAAALRDAEKALDDTILFHDPTAGGGE